MATDTRYARFEVMLDFFSAGNSIMEFYFGD